MRFVCMRISSEKYFKVMENFTFDFTLQTLATLTEYLVAKCSALIENYSFLKVDICQKSSIDD